MNILSDVDYSKLRHVIKSFHESNQKFGQADIIFPLFSSSRGIEWRSKKNIELKSYVDKIDTSLYHEFAINQTYFKNELNFHLRNDTIDTFN